MAIKLTLYNEAAVVLENNDGVISDIFTEQFKIGQEGSMFSSVEKVSDESGMYVRLKYSSDPDLYYKFYCTNGSGQAKYGSKIPNRYGQYRGMYETVDNLSGAATVKFVVSCESAVIFGMATGTGNSNPNRLLAVTSDNDNKPCVIEANIATSNSYIDCINANCRVGFARDDKFNDGCSNMQAHSGVIGSIMFGWNQVVAAPFTGYSSFDDSVYTPDAAFILRGPNPVFPTAVTSGSNSWQRLEFNGYFWLTNGYWLFRDEEVG